MRDLSGTSITIVSACRNESRHLKRFLKSIFTQDMAGMTWEVIIADGMSTDGTRDNLEEYCRENANLRVISNRGRIVSTGLNAAIAEARGQIIIRMDAHSYFAPDYCLRCVETLLDTGADNVGGPAQTAAKGTVARAVAAAYHSRFSTGGARFHDVNYEGWVDTVTYGCWKKTTLERLGLFDESLVRNQDDELNLRLILSGGKIWQNPAIHSVYSPRSTISGLFGQYFQYGFWKVAIVRKHRRPGSWRHLAPACFVLSHLVLLCATLIALAAGATSLLVEAAALWGALTAAYVIADLVASVVAARRHGWATLPLLPIVFAAYHFSYGLGFLIGMLQQILKDRFIPSSDSVFARITR